MIIAGEAADRFGLATVTAWFVVGLTMVGGAAIRFQGRVAPAPSTGSEAVVELAATHAEQLAASA